MDDSIGNLDRLRVGSLEVMRMTGTLGAEIEEIDLSKPIPADLAESIREALRQYKVLVFRNQFSVGPGELLAFGKIFGTVDLGPHVVHPDVPGFVGVKELVSNQNSLVHYDNRSEAAETWHTDGAVRKSPFWVSILQAIDIPPYGRDTAFADMEAIYDELSEPFKQFLEGKTALHWAKENMPNGEPPEEHPVILTDKVTGRKTLYLSNGYAKGIVGLKTSESNAILNFVASKARLLEFQVRVRWRPGTIVVWDNMKTQHYLVLDQAYRRVMHRVMAHVAQD